MILRDKIEEIVQNIIGEEYFIIEISIAGPSNRQKVTIILDGDEGIKIDMCAKVSRTLGAELETLDIINENYILEVTSPGIDYPLKYERQYKRNIGRNFKIELKDDTIKMGILKEIKGDVIVLDEEVATRNSAGKILKNKVTLQETEIAFNEIKKSNVIISFS